MNESILNIPKDLLGPREDILLILGNSFDLDLGLKTRFKDFTNSSYWPFGDRAKYDGLGGFLNHRQKTDEWFDLESAMKEYCMSNGQSSYSQERLGKDKADDKSLVEALKEYLSTIDVTKINLQSKAAELIKNCFASPFGPASIYTFNYTDLSSIVKAIDPEAAYNPNYVHGTLKSHIILGFEHNTKVSGLTFMCKSQRVGYASSGIIKAMNKAKYIVFFGHSFCQIDYNMYFKDFFSKISKGDPKNKFIRIITKDESSRQSILSKLEGLDKLYQNTDFKVIKTSDHEDDSEFDKLYTGIMNPPVCFDVK